MKKLILASFSAFQIITASAQITIEKSDFGSIGDTIKTSVDTVVASVNIGGTGMQSWDFSKFQVDKIKEIYFIDPVTTPNSSAFPNANLTIVNNNDTFYVDAQNSYLDITGLVGDPLDVGINAVLPFQNNARLINTPAKYLDNGTDTAYFTQTVTGSSIGFSNFDSVRLTHYSDIYFEFDAYGQTILLADTMDCLRQYYQEKTTDSIFVYTNGNWMLLPPVPGLLDNNPRIDTVFTYKWFAKNKKYPVLEVVTDGKNGKSIKATYHLGKILLAGNFSVTKPKCNADCNGEAQVSVLNGIPPFSFKWTDGQTTQKSTNLCAGTYTVTVSDGAGANTTATITLTQPDILKDSILFDDASCPTCTDGSAIAFGKGGTAPYTYEWNNGVQNKQISNVGAGNYTVTITDANGCTTSKTLNFVSVNELDNEINFSFFPNPFNDELKITTSDNNTLFSLKLYDATGRLILSEAINTNQKVLNTKNLPSGSYFIIVKNNKEVMQINKLVK